MTTQIKRTTAEFIAKAQAAHGPFTYDYSRAVYKGKDIKVVIICPIHGSFEQRAADHWKGRGCAACNGGLKQSVADFIAKAQAVHGLGTYDYSLVEYAKSDKDIQIICPKHSVFEQRPAAHVSGQGCPQCGRQRTTTAQTLTTADFIAKAQAVHGLGTYDYSLVKYQGNKKKIIILCPMHGEFQQKPNGHLSKQGCPQCGRQRTTTAQTLTTADFIAKAQAVHGLGTYDYSLVEYADTEKVSILCPAHGVFKQNPHSHLRKHGCPKCAALESSIRQTMGVADFIAKAQAVHGLGTYDYSLVEYKKGKSKIKILCSMHGVFEQVPLNHIHGKQGCPQCGRIKASQSSRFTTAEFVAKAQVVHGAETYDYSQVEYIKSDKSVKMKCLIHGFFKQRPALHLYGSGCPKCGAGRTAAASRLSWVEKANGRVGILYFIRLFTKQEEFFKVGITLKSVKSRFKGALNGYQYELLAVHKSSNVEAIYDWEQSILSTFAHLRYRPKIQFIGETECFSSDSEILSIFPL